MKKIALFSVLLIAFTAGCIGQAPQREPLAQLRDGSNCINYNFKHDVYQIMEDVPIQGKGDIETILAAGSRMNILFEGGTDDSPGFALAAFAIVNKLSTWNSYDIGRIFEIDRFDIANETELLIRGFDNRTGVDVLLRGPNTGGTNQTFVRYLDGTIVVQGVDSNALELAGERLALIPLEYLIDNPRQEQLYAERCTG